MALDEKNAKEPNEAGAPERAVQAVAAGERGGCGAHATEDDERDVPSVQAAAAERGERPAAPQPTDRPRVVYVIGGIGSGKSSVSRRLAQLGAPVYDLDAAGHEALRLPDVKRELRDAFGPGVFDEAGEVARARLAQAAFATPEGTAELNRVTTAAIVGLLDEWLARQAAAGERTCVVEVSAYDGPQGRFPAPDETLAVVAPLEARVARAVAKGFDEADVRARIARQATDDERRAWADAVIVNDGTPEELNAAVDARWQARG